MKKKAHTSVMLIDDNQIDNLISKGLINSLQIADSIDTHIDCKSALKTLSSTTKKVPNVILLDINLPLMDGLDFLDEFVKLPKEKIKHCIIYILTCSVYPLDKERAMKNPYVHKWISKPLTIKTLKKLCAKRIEEKN